MVGLPTNVNNYIPLSDSKSIRKISLINFSIPESGGPTELDLNDPAHMLLDMSDLGFSYDVNVSSSGIVTRKIKEKDINLKILVNYATNSSGRYDTGTTTYDALTQFLSKLKVSQWSTTDFDRRGIASRTVPDLVLRWDVPTEASAAINPDGVLSRYRDVVVTDIQWTEVDKQYQGILVDLTLKPVSPWYYRVVKSFTNKSISANGSFTVDMDKTVQYPYLPEDADIYAPIKYNIKLSTSSSISGWHNIKFANQGSGSSDKEVMSFYAPLNAEVNFGNLRNVPYIISGANSMWECLLPGSPTELQLIPEALSAHYYLKFTIDVAGTYRADVEFNIPIRN